MTISDLDLEKVRQEEELRAPRQSDYTSGLFQGDVTLHTLLDSLAEGVVIIDNSGTILLVNSTAGQMFGYSEKELVGTHYSSFYPEEEQQAGKPEEELKKAATEGRVSDEGWRIRKDGSRFWAVMNSTALYDKNGNLRGYSRVTRDITEHKKAEDALHFSEERYRALFRDNPTMIVTLDTDLRMLSVNPICACQLGYTIDELEGRSVLQLFHDDDQPAVAGQLRRCLQNPNQVHRWQFRKIRKDGALLWVEETAQAVYDLSGALNLLVVCQDITERKQAEEERDWIYTYTLDMLCVAGFDRFFKRVSPSFEKILGWSEAELLSTPIFEFIHPDDFQATCQEFKYLEDNKQVINFENRFRCKDGSYKWLSWNSQPLVENKLIIGSARDISEQKQSEEALRISEERYRSLYNETPVMLHSIDHDWRLVSVSTYWLDTLGYARSEVLGRLFTEFLTAESCSYATGFVIPEFFRTGSVTDVPYQIVKKNGEILDVQLSAIAERNSEGKVVRSLAVMVDVTKRNLAEEEIKRLNVSLAARAVDLEYANQELEAFNYTVAHDLRNPLNTIGSYCQVFKEMCSDKLDEPCLRYLRETYEGTLRMNRLIDVLLNFSQLIHTELHSDRVDLSSMAKEVAGELKGTDTARRVTILIEDGIVANGDAGLLRVVLTNLFDNAWKYTAIREEAVIEFGVKEIDGKPVCFIRDNGSGFDNAAAQKIFAPFQRLPGAEECRGFGIGLATVERIIRRHGGRVCAEGEPGTGATFWFTLSAD